MPDAIVKAYRHLTRLPGSRRRGGGRRICDLPGGRARVTLEPADIYESVEMPAIIAMWHGQHFMAPFIKRNDPRHRTKVLISRHRDGEINARAAERLDIGTIRGSGAHNGEFHRKGGAVAFTEMLEALE